MSELYKLLELTTKLTNPKNTSVYRPDGTRTKAGGGNVTVPPTGSPPSLQPLLLLRLFLRLLLLLRFLLLKGFTVLYCLQLEQSV